MAALRKKDLVKDGQYNRAEIMKRAWMYVKNPLNTMYRGNFKWALKRAWQDAKEVVEMLESPAPEYKSNRNVSVADLRPHGRANGFMYGW